MRLSDLPARVRPDIVWFGEVPTHMQEIAGALEGCGLFVAVGTSGHVWPAAGFVAEVRGGARTVMHHGPATHAVLAFVRELLAGPV